MKNKKKPIKTRDYNMVSIINGATKAAVHKDRKKEANRLSSRAKVDDLEEDQEDELFDSCKQCGFPIKEMLRKNPLDPVNDFCSESCHDYYKEQHEQS